MSPTVTQQRHYRVQIKKPLSPQHTETAGDSRVSWGWAIQAVSGFPHRDALPLDLAILEEGSSS